MNTTYPLPPVPVSPGHPVAKMPPLDLVQPFPDGLSYQSNIPPAPAHIILMAAVRGWAHVFNRPAENLTTGRPPRHIWLPAFARSMEKDDWDVSWLRLAQVALQREQAIPETLAAVSRLEEFGFSRALIHAFADVLAT